MPHSLRSCNFMACSANLLARTLMPYSLRSANLVVWSANLLVQAHMSCPLRSANLMAYSFVFDWKKKTWFTKKFTFTKHVLGMKLKALFPKHAFGKKYGKGIGSQEPMAKYLNINSYVILGVRAELALNGLDIYIC